MSDLTTEELRQDYIDHVVENAWLPPSDALVAQIGAEFDRWLNEQLARAWAEGRGAPSYRTNLHGDYLGPVRNPYRKADS